MTTTAQTDAEAARENVLRELRAAARAKARAEARVKEADAQVASLIKQGFDQKIPGSQLADAAGISKPRAFQIRDGRR